MQPAALRRFGIPASAASVVHRKPELLRSFPVRLSGLLSRSVSAARPESALDCSRSAAGSGFFPSGPANNPDERTRAPVPGSPVAARKPAARIRNYHYAEMSGYLPCSYRFPFFVTFRSLRAFSSPFPGRPPAPAGPVPAGSCQSPQLQRFNGRHAAPRAQEFPVIFHGAFAFLQNPVAQ